MKSYISSKIEKRSSGIGSGLYATQTIRKGEIIIDYNGGPGRIIGIAEADELYNKGYDYMIQVDDDKFFAATSNEEVEDTDYLNHSCNPNCGIRGSITIVAMRDIEEGEEITIDYAMAESSDYEMKCDCKSVLCRKAITGNDYKIEALQERYKGYFSDYLADRIKRLNIM